MSPRPVLRSCKKCGASFILKESRSKFCLTCRGSRRKENDTGMKTLGHYRQKGSVHPSWLLSEIRNHCRWVNKHRLKRCQVCDYDFYVEHAHVKAISEFSDETLVSEVNDPANVLILCPNHHKEFDRSPEKKQHILSVVQLDRTPSS